LYCKGAEETKKGSRIRSLLTSRLFLMLMAVFVAGYFANRFLTSLGGPEKVMEVYGIWAPIVTIAVFAILNLSYFPVDLMAVANGAIYGVPLGATLTWIARMIVAVVEYYVGKQGARDLDLDIKLGKIPWLNKFPVSHPLFLIGVRYVPYGGGHLANLVAGSRHVPWRRHLWTAAIAVALAAAVEAMVGAAIISL